MTPKPVDVKDAREIAREIFLKWNGLSGANWDAVYGNLERPNAVVADIAAAIEADRASRVPSEEEMHEESEHFCFEADSEIYRGDVFKAGARWALRRLGVGT